MIIVDAELDLALADVLARLASLPEEARALLQRAGFPPGFVPWSSNAITFWTTVVASARDGAVTDGVAAIAQAAVEQYPSNPELARIATQLKVVPRPPEGELYRYRAKAHSLHHTVQVLGPGTKMLARIALEDVYVQPHVVIARMSRGRDTRSARRAETGQRDAGPSPERHPFATALQRTWSSGTRGVVLLGAPGSGKTTQLAHVLLEVIKPGGAESLGLPKETVPVLLALRNLEDPAAGLPDLIRRELHGPAGDLDEDFGRRLCMRGGVLYLLDGLDEVAEAKRAEVARWIYESHRHAPDSYFLVSSGHAGYTGEVQLDTSFVELHLQPFDDAQVRAFVTRWYTSVEQKLCGDAQQADREARYKANDLLRALSRVELLADARVAEMRSNALLLRVICLVHRDRERMEHAHARLYEEILVVLARRWQARTARALQLPVVLEVLELLAAWMHEQPGRVRVSRSALSEQLGHTLSRLPGTVGMEPDALLRALDDDASLLVEWAPDEHGFAYLGLHEYLVARQRCKQEQEQADGMQGLAARFADPWWQEVIVLMLSLGGASVFDAFMRAVVRRPELAEWADSEMMRRCLWSPHGSVEPFVEVFELAESTEGAGDLAARQLAVLGLLRRESPQRLHGLQEVLHDHPVEAVRARWRELAWRVAPEVERVVAPRGGVELLLVPGGRFVMGSARGDGDRDEHPQHEVELDSFYLARTPVTNAQYAEYLRAKPSVSPPRFWGNELYNQPSQPVVGVSWYDARDYCEWAGLVLPTEAQWEYACRAGTLTRYWSGDREDDLERVAWCFGNSNARLQFVGAKEPMGFGLHDMHGNIWEWCLDVYGSYEIGARAGDGLRHAPANAAKRVRRGGGFRALADFARSAIRGFHRPDERYDDLGFRPAWAPR